MPPLWKVKRELIRLLWAPGRALAELFRIVFVRRYYDHVQARQIRYIRGQLQYQGDISLYLIFPSHGILPSHLHVLNEMKDANISPIVVSNLPLSDADLALISPMTVCTVLRPNVGYDFGGYRDGILHIADRLPHIERLWLLNDSAWMVPQPNSWFADARALDVDFAAATSNFAMPRVDPELFREITWAFDTGHRNFHYASYALGIGSAILQDPDFLRFWKRLEIRDDKKRTVRRGEIGLSQWVLSKGYSHAATFEIDDLDSDLASMSNEDVDKIAQELVIPESRRLELQKFAVLETDPTSARGRSDRIALILAAVSRQASGYVLPGYSLRCRGFQFLKKSPLKLSDNGAQITNMLIDRIEGKTGQDIAVEAQVIQSSKT